MTTKKLFRVLPLALLLAIAVPANSVNVAPNPVHSNNSPATEDPRAQQLLQRLENIRDMNKSALTRSEKKELRKEVKEIKKEMKTIKGGVYLSVGAIIIVILLLILIL